MCKNKIIIKNKRYQPTKKNGYTKETPRDRRLSYIEIPCGECKECKKKRKEMWRKTGYEAQGQQIENAGLNKALMYGGG